MGQTAPFTIQLELTQGCNRKCSFCGLRGMENKVYFMPREILEHFIGIFKATGWNSKIILAMHGEPTLHPNFLKCIKMLRKSLPKTLIHLMTNGTQHDKYSPKDCLESGVTNYILDLYKDTVDLPQSMDMTGLTVETIEKGLYTPKKRVLINQPINEDTKINRSLCNHCGAGMKALDEPMSKKCAKPFRELTIRWDGNVCICCNDFRGEYLVGNIQDYTDIEELWNHPRFVAARKRLYHSDRDFHPCSLCNATSHRIGLLPDKMGKETLDKPTEKDIKITNKRSEPCAVIVKRKWEV